MLHVESLAPGQSSANRSDFVQPATVLRKSGQTSVRLIETTFRTIEFDGRNLWREPEDVAISQLVEAVRLADLHGKSELMIKDITPWIEVGQAESCQVPVIQLKIQAKLEVACKKAKRPFPECRLDLSHGVYGIRCYLSRNKPTDHVHEEDFVSDSR